MARIKEKPDTLILPSIDIITDTTFEYKGGGEYITGFIWNMLYNWMPVPQRELDRRKNPTDPVR